MDEVRTVFYERDERTATGLTAQWASVSTADGGSRLEMTWARPTERAGALAAMAAVSATAAAPTKATADDLPSQRGRVTA